MQNMLHTTSFQLPSQGARDETGQAPASALHLRIWLYESAGQKQERSTPKRASIALDLAHSGQLLCSPSPAHRL
jgi:hypothetical protein